MTNVLRNIFTISFALVASFSMRGLAGAELIHNVTVKNSCAFSQPIWVGAAGPDDVTPSNGWELAGICNANSDCASGQTCKNGFCSCTSSTDCHGATCGTNGTCVNQTTLALKPHWNGRIWPRTECSGSGAALICKTGDCNGQLDCKGSSAKGATLFEPNFGVENTADFYDVSLVSGYNVPLSVKPKIPSDTLGWNPNQSYSGAASIIQNVNGTTLRFFANPGGNSGNTPPNWPAAATLQQQLHDNQILWQNFGGKCGTVGCVADLNSTCPVGLQVKDHGTVISCIDPCTACSEATPDPSLKCQSLINPSNSAEGTYQDMYCCKKVAGGVGTSMASGLGGTPTCFADNDCAPATTCTKNPALQTPLTLPPGSGICFPTDPKGCVIGSNDACSNYPFPNYRCNTLTTSQQAACLPPTISGLGDILKNPVTSCNADVDCHGTGACINKVCQPPDVYTGTCGVFNPDWVKAGIQAGGGTTAYYELFRNACPTGYAWQFDDDAGQYTCDNTAIAVDYDMTFCPSPPKTAN
jgi:hypothetical protein